jgi:hypothetical protein
MCKQGVDTMTNLVTNSNPVTSTIKKALKTQRFRAFFFAIDT